MYTEFLQVQYKLNQIQLAARLAVTKLLVAPFVIVKGVDAQDCWTAATKFVAGVGTGAGVLPRTLNGEGVRLR